ncbi:MAG: glycosyltransferase, partial [Bacteroidales bacterium]|nr:glycosyltransferase [Bacteroidales bacterium]
SARSITNTNQIIANYLYYGATKQNLFKSLKERFVIMAEHYGVLSTLALHMVYFVPRVLVAKLRG